MSSERITILIADEHMMYREALALALAQDAAMQVVGKCGNGPEVLALYHKLQPDIILIDITLQHGRGLAATKQILLTWPGARIIWLSTSFIAAWSERMQTAGAREYLNKTMSYPEILAAVHRVYEV